MIRFLISEMWSVCSKVLTGMMYNWSAKYFCRLTWEILKVQNKLSHHLRSQELIFMKKAGVSGRSLSSQFSTRPALLGWKMLQQCEEFQFWLPVHIIATFPRSRNVLYRGCCKDSRPNCYNDNLKANIYIQFQFPENKTLDFNQILACWESIWLKDVKFV